MARSDLYVAFQCASVPVPFADTVNLFLTEALWSVSPHFKQSTVSPLSKKSTLDKDELSNYTVRSQTLTFRSHLKSSNDKTNTVKSRLTDHHTLRTLQQNIAVEILLHGYF